MSTTASTQTHRTTSTHNTTTPSRHTSGRKGGVNLCGPCVKSFETAVERADKKERERSGPKSWLERKFAVGMVIALFGWSNYVFWGVIFRKSWERAEDALVGFAPGIVLTIIYGFFALMFLLSYLKIILTPPGFAKDYVQPSEPPLAPEPPPLTYPPLNYNTNNPPYDDPSYHVYDGTQNPPDDHSDDPDRIVYPPSRKAPTSEYRASMEEDDRITHQTLSLDDHGEFDDLGHSSTQLNTTGVGGAKDPLGVPYELMPTRPPPAHTKTRDRSASNTAILPSTPKPLATGYSTGYPPSSTTTYHSSNTSPYPPSRTMPTTLMPTPMANSRPAVLNKRSSTGESGTGSSPATPTIPTQSTFVGGGGRPNKMVRASSTSSRTTATPSSPTTKQSPTTTITTTAQSSSNATSKVLTDTTSKSLTTPTIMGFQYESKSYILDPPRLSSQTQAQRQTTIQNLTRSTTPQNLSRHSHTRTRSDSHMRTGSDPQARNTNANATASPFDVSPTTPTHAYAQTPTQGIASSSNHATQDFSGGTKPPDSRPVPYLDELPPRPYTADLPPIAPNMGGATSTSASRWDRKPSDKPVLESYYRYCSRDGIVKPPRCHHCRICNTCVLGYDHHCPWVGGCVGAQNRKFFLVFVFWCTVYLLYTLALLIATIVTRANRPRPITFAASSLDPNLLVLLLCSILFLIFSSGMLGTHIHLLRYNASTVEWHGVQSMRQRERAVVSQLVPVCECLGMGSGHGGNGGLLGRKERDRWGDEELGEVKGALPRGYRGRVALRKKWDQEWGRIGKEGNLWWLGSARQNWEAVMGTNPWTWFLPLGDVSGVGVEYPRNPRFDEQGRWMKRNDWPEELR